MKYLWEKNLLSNDKNKKYQIIIDDKFLKKRSELFITNNKFTLTNKYICYLIVFILFISLSFLLYKFLFHKYLVFFKLSKFFVPNTYRIAFVFGTRPEAVKLFPLIKELKENNNFICIVINTGQHKEMIQQILDSLQMDDSIDFNLNLMKNNQSLSELTSKSISELEKIYNLITPNAIIVQGDTTTAFSAAVAGFYLKIPIFHVEAGLRTHNLYYPYPEEFNRITIDDISTLYFAPTDWSANNLLEENKNSSNIFITGNTIVDSLKYTLNNTSPSKELNFLIENAKSLCVSSNGCKILLLTCHRRENYFKPIFNILTAVQELLKNFNDIVVIFPFHLNPNVRQSIKNAIPDTVYNDLIKGKKITNSDYLHLNRFVMIPPLNYIDLIHLQSASYFIMSDSGGIQEEAVSIGKPIIILRENTERPEAVKSGCAFISGISSNKIYYYASSLLRNDELYNNISKPQYIYGKGNSSIIISQIIQNYFINNKLNSISINNINFNDILYKYDNNLLKCNKPISMEYKKKYDIVIVLTVWKRNNLERQLIQIQNQSILENKRTNIIIFQNSNHTNIENILNKWKSIDFLPNEVDITFIQSPIETGYFGRFIIPLTSSVDDNTYFFICDDDIIWGNRYFENMVRVINGGSLATRNGRIIGQNFEELIEPYKKGWNTKHICYNEDIEFDFGGHIWAGLISWLRKVWNHPPISLENSEDFWISAVLKSFYNISTKTPKCPCPEGNIIKPDMCAASDKSSFKHENAKIGNSNISHKIRTKLIKEITLNYNYKRLILLKPEYVKNIYNKYVFGDLFFNLSHTIWKDVIMSEKQLVIKNYEKSGNLLETERKFDISPGTFEN